MRAFFFARTSASSGALARARASFARGASAANPKAFSGASHPPPTATRSMGAPCVSSRWTYPYSLRSITSLTYSSRSLCL